MKCTDESGTPLIETTKNGSRCSQDDFRHEGKVAHMLGQLQATDAASLKFESFFDLLPTNTKPAIYSVEGQSPMTFTQLRKFIARLDLHSYGICRSDRVCVVIPNGPELAVAFLAISTYCVYAPLNFNLTAREFEFEFEDLPAKAVIVKAQEETAGNTFRNDGLSSAVTVAVNMNLPILQMLVDISCSCGEFALAWHPASPCQLSSIHRSSPVKRSDLALVLHTSGTTKKPKIVPLTHENIAVGALCISSTLQLTEDDTCINVMPLFHIHGLIINVLASLLSGAAVLATPGFGVDDFLSWLSSLRPTWYSAVPTMHQLVLESANTLHRKNRQGPQHCLKLIRNCSAALLPHIAESMASVFNCIVMPTYAMTESMPIASNPRTADRGLCKLRADSHNSDAGRVGSVGYSGGPEICVLASGNTPVAMSEEGEVCVSGACVTAGYENRQHMDTDPNLEAFHIDKIGCKWLHTGDKGWIDSNGMLALTGRFKEIINRGGEKISPFEVEEVLRTHSMVKDMIAFAAPHAELGETVGLAILARKDGQLSEAGEAMSMLRNYGSKMGLNSKWLPDCLVFMQDIPRGPTGKPARINLAARLGLPTLTGAERAVWEVCGPNPANDKEKYDPSLIRKCDHPAPSSTRVSPSLHSLRALFAFWVLANHIGHSTSRIWLKLRPATLSMIGTNFILGFTTATSAYNGLPVTEWPEFWASRFAAAHSVFVFSAFLGIVAYLLRCPPSKWQECGFANPNQVWVFHALACAKCLIGYGGEYNPPTWFQPVMYSQLLAFPFLHKLASSLRQNGLRAGLLICVGGFSVVLPQIKHALHYKIQRVLYYSPLMWILVFGAGVFAAHAFMLSSQRSRHCKRLWGLATDMATAAFLLLHLVIALDSCFPLYYPEVQDTYICNDDAWDMNFRASLRQAKCIAPQSFWYPPGSAIRKWSWTGLGTPLLMFWIYGLAVGEGITAKLLSSSVLSRRLAPVAYNIYLLHWPIAWFYYYMICGTQIRPWFHTSHNKPFPLSLGDGMITCAIIIFVSWALSEHLTAFIMPPCLKIYRYVFGLLRRPLFAVGRITGESKQHETTIDKMLQQIRQLTGAIVTPDTHLAQIGLDSFGTAALLGALRGTFPAAWRLKPAAVRQCHTVADLASKLDQLILDTGSAKHTKEE